MKPFRITHDTFNQTDMRKDILKLEEDIGKVQPERFDELNEKLAQKVSELYVDEKFSLIGSASPKGVYATLTDLETAFPTGNNNIYVVEVDGNWYYWSGSAWVAGGLYQSTGLSDGAVSLNKTSVNLQDLLLKDNIESTVNGSLLKLSNYVEDSAIKYTASANATKLITYDKNLIDPTLFTETYVDITIDDNIITAVNTRTYKVESELVIYLAAGTYTLSATDSPSSIPIRDINNTYITGMNAGNNAKLTFTIATSGQYKIVFSVNASSTIQIVDLMLEVSNVKTTFDGFGKKKEYTIGSPVLVNDVVMTDGDSVEVTYKTKEHKQSEGGSVPSNIAYNPLYGKKVLWNGDSIMIAGSANNQGWDYLIKNENNMTSVNYAVAGGTIADNSSTGRHSVIKTLASMDAVADYIIFEGGVNDPTYSTLGALSSGFTATLDETTFYGAFESLLKKAQIKWTGKKIGFIIPYKTTGTYQNSQNQYEPFYAATKEVLEKWSIPYIDLYKMSGWSVHITEVKDALFADTWHMKEEGYLATYEKVQAWMKTL